MQIPFLLVLNIRRFVNVNMGIYIFLINAKNVFFIVNFILNPNENSEE